MSPGVRTVAGLIISSITSQGWNATNSSTQTASGIEGLIPGYHSFCPLWNSSCTGNQTVAYAQFQKHRHWVGGSFCTSNDSAPCSLDGVTVPQSLRSGVSEMLSFARSPRCYYLWDEGFDIPTLPQPSSPCCGPCTFEPTAVDLYYWPEEGANDSCLSIVGNDVHPLEFGATTGTNTWVNPYGTPVSFEVATYFGCTVLAGFEATAQTITVSPSYQTSAVLTSIGTLTYKSPMVNPWSAYPCMSDHSDAPATPQSLPTHQKVVTRLHTISKRTLSSAYNINETAAYVISQNGHTL